jgi:hypothetical protein
MPIRKVTGGYKWGNHGTVYSSRKDAERQAAAAHANGFTGDDDTKLMLALIDVLEQLLEGRHGRNKTRA